MAKKNYFENLSFQGGKKINISNRIDANFSDTLHWHAYAELLLSLCDGNEVTVDFTDYRLKTNDLVFVYSGSLHSVRYITEESFLVIQFPLELLTVINDYKPVISALSGNPLIPYNPLSAENSEIIFALSQIRIIDASAARFHEAASYSLLLKVFLLIGQLLSAAAGEKLSSNEKVNSKNTDIIAEACLYISENCTQPLTLEDTAHHIGLSKSHFSHLLKTYTNMTFVEFLTAERIKRAEAFFLDSNMHIVDVAFESGFSSLSSFNRSFRRLKGCSPTEFRKTRVD